MARMIRMVRYTSTCVSDRTTIQIRKPNCHMEHDLALAGVLC